VSRSGVEAPSVARSTATLSRAAKGSFAVADAAATGKQDRRRAPATGHALLLLVLLRGREASALREEMAIFLWWRRKRGLALSVVYLFA
jgi:hypothetical protein